MLSSSSFAASWWSHLQSLFAHVQARPLVSAAAIGIVPLVAHIIPSYRGFLALGPGGLPSNFLGWTMQAILQPIGRTDLIGLSPYRDPKTIREYGAHGRTSFLGDEPLPQRRGNRPEVPTYVGPQRQATETGSTADMSRMNGILAQHALQNPSLLSIQPSGLEGKTCDSLWLSAGLDELPKYQVRRTNGELFHVHSEGSSHAILSLADAEAAVQKGWAQRHKLTGVVLPWSYVMIYAPRDEEEFAVWKRFVEAAVRFSVAQLGKESQLRPI